MQVLPTTHCDTPPLKGREHANAQMLVTEKEQQKSEGLQNLTKFY